MSLFSVSVLRFLVGEMRQRFLPGPQGFGRSKLIAWDKKKDQRSSFLPLKNFLHLHRGLEVHPLKWKLSELEWAKMRSDKTTETLSSCWSYGLQGCRWWNEWTTHLLRGGSWLRYAWIATVNWQRIMHTRNWSKIEGNVWYQIPIEDMSKNHTTKKSVVIICQWWPEFRF